jgi:hypothetical protein
MASIRNAAGHFVRPDLDSIEAAAQAMGKPKPDNSIPLVDPPASATDADLVGPIRDLVEAVLGTG